MRAALANQPHVVYRAYDDEGELLYVGATVDLKRRLAEHRDNSYWWAAVTTLTSAEYPDWASARAAENAAITDERPLWNVVRPSAMTTAPPRTILTETDRAALVDLFDPARKRCPTLYQAAALLGLNTYVVNEFVHDVTRSRAQQLAQDADPRPDRRRRNSSQRRVSRSDGGEFKTEDFEESP